MCRRRVKKELFSSRARGLCPRKHGTSTTWNVPLSLTLHIQTLPPAFLQGFWRWRRVTKELFSSRVGFADIRRGAPTLVRETALSLVCFSEKLSPRIKCEIFCALAESKERTLQFACRRNADIRRGSHACVGNGVISLLSISKPYPPHKMRDFLCCFAGA